MEPTTDELIRLYNEAKGNSNLLEAFWHGRLKGRLDVLEKYLSRVDSTDSARIREEIKKIKAVLS